MNVTQKEGANSISVFENFKKLHFHRWEQGKGHSIGKWLGRAQDFTPKCLCHVVCVGTRSTLFLYSGGWGNFQNSRPRGRITKAPKSAECCSIPSLVCNRAWGCFCVERPEASSPPLVLLSVLMRSCSCWCRGSIPSHPSNQAASGWQHHNRLGEQWYISAWDLLAPVIKESELLWWIGLI